MRDPLLAFLADDRHASRTGVITGKACPDFVEEAPVNLVNDFQVARQHLAEHRQRPRLERLRQKRMVGVAEGSHGDPPRRLPVDVAIVHQQTHQLGDGDRRMRVVELNGEALREPLHRHVGGVERVQHVLQ